MGKWLIHQRENGSIIVIFFHLNGAMPPQVCYDGDGYSVESMMEALPEMGPLAPFEWVEIRRPGSRQVLWSNGKRAQA